MLWKQCAEVVIVVTAVFPAVIHSSESEVNFLVLADWGGMPVWPYVSPFQYAVAEQMGKTASKHSAEFVLGTCFLTRPPNFKS